jgi:hypothetical protein
MNILCVPGLQEYFLGEVKLFEDVCLTVTWGESEAIDSNINEKGT